MRRRVRQARSGREPGPRPTPRLWPCTIAATIAAMVAAITRAPRTSGAVRPSSRISGSTRQPMSTAMTPIGMLTRNTQRQSSLHEKSADRRSGRSGCAGHRRPQSERGTALLRREQGEQQAERARQHQGAADGLHDPSGHEHAERGGGRASGRRDGEQRETAQERPLAPGLVRPPACGITNAANVIA